MKQMTVTGSSSREQHRILAAILDFVEETEKCEKKYQANSPGPVYILQIFGGEQTQQKQSISTTT